MIRTMRLALSTSAIALLVAGSAYAGGASCGAKDAEAKSAAAKSASAGHHCGSGASGASAMAKACGLKDGQSIYSFAVPAAECDNCVKSIQTALMAQKGVTCAHVDLTSRTAYIIADRSVNKKAVAKTIQYRRLQEQLQG